MEQTAIREFEIRHEATDYVIDFDVYWYIRQEQRTHDYPGSWDIIIEGIVIQSAEYYDEETDDWIKSELTDKQLIGLILTKDETLKSMLKS